MKFLFDHDVPDDAAFSLEALGHVVVKLPGESGLRDNINFA